jgi:hypothetical protein
MSGDTQGWRAVSDTKGFIAALTQNFIEQGGVRVRGQVEKIDEVSDRASGVTLVNGERYKAGGSAGGQPSINDGLLDEG